MKEDERIKTWEDFEEVVKKFYSKAQEFKAKNGNDAVSVPLFRGQSDKKWGLESTLDRWQKDFPVAKYHRIIQNIKPATESFTSKRWQLTEKVEEFVKAIDGPSPSGKPVRDFGFMAYLRHSGFPSPFLDWTKSSYIAAFFAFSEDRETDPAIFMYLGRTNAGNTSDHRARIDSVESSIITHQRHSLQKSEYTYCIKGINSLCYTSHEDAFSVRETESSIDLDYLDQDILEKYTLPYSQRANFLSKLNSININAYSLFETEEGLMNKLANEEFLIEDI